MLEGRRDERWERQPLPEEQLANRVYDLPESFDGTGVLLMEPRLMLPYPDHDDDRPRSLRHPEVRARRRAMRNIAPIPASPKFKKIPYMSTG